MSDSVSGISANSVATVQAQTGSSQQVEVQKKAQDSQTQAMQQLIANFTGVGQMVNRTA